jgi:hypothetical protein
MQDARRLMGRRGKLAYRYLVKGPTSKLHFVISLRGTGVEYFYQIAVTCLKMIANPGLIDRYLAVPIIESYSREPPRLLEAEPRIAREQRGGITIP